MKRWIRAALPVLLAGAACADAPTSPTTSRVFEEDAEALESIPGILESTRVLRSGDARIQLVGWQTRMFTDLIGAEVLIDGRIDPSDGALIIHEFLVLAVDGVPALDGTLLRQETEFFIRSSVEDRTLPQELPGALLEHVGRRVWLTIGSTQLRYGLLY